MGKKVPDTKFSRNTIGGYTIINRDFEPFLAYYTYQSHISNWHDLMYDSISPGLSVPNYLNPDIIGSLHWTASDNQGIYSQKLFINNDTIQLDTAVRSFSGTYYNGWHTYKGLEVRDYAWNKASDNDSIRVALFDESSNDFTIDLHFTISSEIFGKRYVYLSSIFPSDCIFYVIYYRKNNDPWKIKTSKGTGYKNILLDSTTNLRDKFTAFSCSYLWNGNIVFNHYSNICSIGGGITPKLFSNNGNKYILEYELFTPDRTDNAILLKNNALIGNNFKFRIINSDKNTYIDNIKLYAVDSKKDISLKNTKDEISITNGKSIKTELEQESFDSKLSIIDEKYYILKPNDTFDFTFKNIDMELSEGYTRDYVMEITGYQADDTIDFISGIADKRKKLLKNDVRMIRSIGSSLKIEFSSIRDREINLKVCDLSGRILRNEKIDLSKGRKNYLIESLSQGVYLIKADNKSFKGIILK